jgi:hypothetical protein
MSTPASCKPGSAKPNGPNPKATVPAVGGLFFPQSKALGIDQTDASPAIQKQISYAGTASRSFTQASAMLLNLADLSVNPKQVERVTQRIGSERVAERDAHIAAFQALPLPKKFEVPEAVTAADLAVVMVDGGRMQILDRQLSKASTTEPPPPASPAADAPPSDPPLASSATEPIQAHPPGSPTPAEPDWDEEPPAASGHWREDKVGLLLTMKSEASAVDPCPEIPASFLDVVRIPKLARQLKKNARAGEDAVADTDAPEAAAEALQAETVYQPPEVVERQVAASRGKWQSFAPLLAAAAWALGFQGAERKAFVGDGSANNWKLQRRFFASFVPILDFIHALSYVFAAALAGRKFAAGWVCYRQWIGWVWQGDVSLVIAALQQRQTELGLPEKGESETSPRQVVSKTLTYLRNQQDKMKYADYRRAGLPITSSLMESTVKQIGERVKGTEKFWSERGSEPILQLRADQLSDGEPLEEFWDNRQAAATGQRPYRRVG